MNEYFQTYNRIEMLSSTSKMYKIHISLSNQPDAKWSKPFSLESTDGIINLIERDIVKYHEKNKDMLKKSMTII